MLYFRLLMVIFGFRVALDPSQFSSKTAYRFSNLQPFKDLAFSKDCHKIFISGLFRHGTRNPGKADIIRTSAVLKKISLSKNGQAKLPKEFLNWKPAFDINNANKLTLVGYQEMQQLGERFRQRYKNNYSPYYSKFYTSSVSRSIESAISFLKGFLPDTDPTLKMSIKDEQLRFFDYCPRYISSVVNNKSASEEYYKFLNGPEMKQVVKNIQEKWKLTDIDLNSTDVLTLYTMCGIEIATNRSCNMLLNGKPNTDSVDGTPRCETKANFVPKDTSILCSLFEPEHFSIFEYVADLKHYWTKAYGHKINWLISCDVMYPMYIEILNSATDFKASTKSNPLPEKVFNFTQGVFRFGHAETLLPLIALLNMFNQTFPMTANDFQTRLNSLKDLNQRFSTFKVSNISPFSGNMALEVYYCSNEEGSERYRIQLTSNEKVISWLLGNGRSYITLDELIKHMNICIAKNYNQKVFCQSASLLVSNVYILYIGIYFIFFQL